MTKHTKINLKQLAIEIRTMNSRKEIYKLLKKELTILGHWRDKGRGDPSKGYKVMRNKQNGTAT
jgi:hypothetical protein